MAAAVIDIHPDIRVVQNQAQRQIRFISTLQQYVLTSATGRPGVGRDHFLRQGVHQYFLPVIPVKTLIQIGIYPVYRQISLAVFVNPPDFLFFIIQENSDFIITAVVNPAQVGSFISRHISFIAVNSGCTCHQQQKDQKYGF